MIEKIQQLLQKESLDAWLFYDFRKLDPSANSILKIPKHTMLTRRWFYLVPASGKATKIAHKIEPKALDHLPGERILYSGWKELHEIIKQVLTSHTNICMQYSPMNAIPYVSYVDAGTWELVKSAQVNIHSSANLIQVLEAIWGQEGIDSHNRAIGHLRKTVDKAFFRVKEAIHNKEQLTEYQLQQFIVEEITQHNMIYGHAPIVATNSHAGDPHYEPQEQNSAILQEGDLLLIDLWAKETHEQAIYGDITWIGFIGKEVPEKYSHVFNIVKKARDTAVDFINNRLANNQEIYGYEVDDQARNVITESGYGEYFVHRTGHSIGQELHWKGVNIDNLETKDERKLIDGIGFSIEPGIYLKDFGIRSEINVYLHQGKAVVSGLPAQENIIPIMTDNI